MSELGRPVAVGQSEPLDTDFQAPAAAENNYDDGALHRHQVAALQHHLDQLRRDNEAYLAHHTELRQLVAGFVGAVVDEQPDDVRDFASQYFAEANQRRRQADVRDGQSPPAGVAGVARAADVSGSSGSGVGGAS